MSTLIQNLVGMADMTEEVIATDFLMATKAEVRNYAAAISEAVSPEVREVLKRQLMDAIKAHESITNYMISKGYYHAYDPQRQLLVDLDNIEAVMGLKERS